MKNGSMAIAILGNACLTLYFANKWVNFKRPLEGKGTLQKCVDAYCDGDVAIFKLQNNATFKLKMDKLTSKVFVGHIPDMTAPGPAWTTYRLEVITDVQPAQMKAVSRRDQILQVPDVENCSMATAKQKEMAEHLKWQVRGFKYSTGEFAVRLNRVLGLPCFNAELVNDLESGKYLITDEVVELYQQCC